MSGWVLNALYLGEKRTADCKMEVLEWKANKKNKMMMVVPLGPAVLYLSSFLFLMQPTEPIEYKWSGRQD